MFRLVKGKDNNIDVNELITFDKNGKTRGHELKLKKLNGTKNCRKYHFTRRVFQDWNRLSTETVLSTSLDAFKVKIDRDFSDAHWCID